MAREGRRCSPKFKRLRSRSREAARTGRCFRASGAKSSNRVLHIDANAAAVMQKLAATAIAGSEWAIIQAPRPSWTQSEKERYKHTPVGAGFRDEQIGARSISILWLMRALNQEPALSVLSITGLKLKRRDSCNFKSRALRSLSNQAPRTLTW